MLVTADSNGFLKMWDLRRTYSRHMKQPAPLNCVQLGRLPTNGDVANETFDGGFASIDLDHIGERLITTTSRNRFVLYFTFFGCNFLCDFFLPCGLDAFFSTVCSTKQPQRIKCCHLCRQRAHFSTR
jgi:hypothetical protein